MAKITLIDIASGYNLSAINSNLQAIADVLNNNVLWRDNPVGEPNQMVANGVDMNSNRILNLPTPVASTEPVRLQDLGDYQGNAAASAAAAAASATQAATSATQAQTSATASATSATNAATSASNAQADAVILDTMVQELANSIVTFNIFDLGLVNDPVTGTAIDLGTIT